MSWLCLVMNLIFLRSNDVVIADGLMDDEIDSVTNFFVHVWASVFVRLKIGVSSYIPRSNFSGDGDSLLIGVKMPISPASTASFFWVASRDRMPWYDVYFLALVEDRVKARQFESTRVFLDISSSFLKAIPIPCEQGPPPTTDIGVYQQPQQQLISEYKYTAIGFEKEQQRIGSF